MELLERLPKTLRAAIAGRPHFELSCCEAELDALDVLCLPSLGAFDHVKLHLLTFLKAAEAAGLNGGEMHEDILAVLAADEPIALSVVKPLHCSCFHVVACSFVLDVALKLSGFFCRQVTRWVKRRCLYCEGTLKSNANILYVKLPKNSYIIPNPDVLSQ